MSVFLFAPTKIKNIFHVSKRRSRKEDKGIKEGKLSVYVAKVYSYPHQSTSSKFTRRLPSSTGGVGGVGSALVRGIPYRINILRCAPIQKLWVLVPPCF